jgi:hypothetical protein
MKTPLARKRASQRIATVSLMLVFSVAGAFFLTFIGADALAERHPFQFFADSNTYMQTYAGLADNFDGTLVGVGSNYLGPLTVLHVLQGNIYLVMLLNVYMFTHALLHIAKLLQLDPLRITLLLFLNPLTASSLLSVNKEIFVFPFLAFGLHAYLRGSLTAMLLATACSILVRWQLTGFYLLLVGIASGIRIFRSRLMLVVVLLVCISVAYRLIQPLIQPVLEYVQNSIETYEGGGSGLFEWELSLQNQGLYFLVFPIKAFHLLFGMGLKLDKIFNPVEIYNDFFVSGHCLASFLLFATLAWRRRITLRSDWIFIVVIFLAVFCVTPVFAPRYLFFVYVLGVLAIIGAPTDLRRLRAAVRSRRKRRRTRPASPPPPRPPTDVPHLTGPNATP